MNLNRIKQASGIATGKLPIGTFHSLANRAVRELAHLLGIEPPTDVLKDSFVGKSLQNSGMLTSLCVKI